MLSVRARYLWILAPLAMIGPFSLDAYLPAFPAMADALAVPESRLQATLSAYLIAFAATTLLVGPWSDSRGRREPLLVALAVYAAASLGIVLAPNLETLLVLRAVQGAAAAVGIVVGRAVVRDRFPPDEARGMYAQVMLWFSIGPALAPVVGGVVLATLGWRAIFVALTLYAVVMWWAVVRVLPETLPVAGRVPASLSAATKRYARILTRRGFLHPVAVFALLFAGLFTYIASAPDLVYHHLGGSETDFWWLFGPLVTGLVTGAWAAGRASERRLPERRTLWIGMAIVIAVLVLQTLGWWASGGNGWWFVLPLSGYSFGLAWMMPALTVAALDAFPQARGSVSAMQSFLQLSSAAALTAFVTPHVVGEIGALIAINAVLVGAACVALATWPMPPRLCLGPPRRPADAGGPIGGP